MKARKRPAQSPDAFFPVGQSKVRESRRKRRSQAAPSKSPETRSGTTVKPRAHESEPAPAGAWPGKAKIAPQNAAAGFAQTPWKQERTWAPPKSNRNWADGSTMNSFRRKSFSGAATVL